ncbi:Alkylated DNA repair protein alkB-like 8 [Holothuria leucospilota]|uniref:tRNA (carboxymethyluridine(34)-5-O)-methyltransferase n=1 Tax=Holothuria leucospilota TaxID=206669 RepID=A0A9Q1C1Q0_HOLLE|nr:Alkylated DNA repair protein alkB-like 8 [Holothuria leucospilota]
MERKLQEKKLTKRAMRKRAKCCKFLAKSGNISIVDEPTKYLVIANGGLGNGVSREEIVTLFQDFGSLESVIMEEHSPHCFVTFQTAEVAKIAKDQVDGHELAQSNIRQQACVKLYVSFVNDVPSISSQVPKLPDGLFLIEDFVDDDTERKLLDLVEWDSPAHQGSMKHRKVKHYGYEFNYDTNNINKDCPLEEPLPDLLVEMIDKIMQTGHVTKKLNQVTVNQYLPGQGIPPHVDTHSAFEDSIVSLSLGSGISMDFAHPNGTNVSKVLPPRSLLVMTGEARYLWSHGIIPRKTDVIPDTAEGREGNSVTLAARGTRTSFTFRAVRGRPCDCKFPSKCDSARTSQTELPSGLRNDSASTEPMVAKPVSEEEAIQLEQSQVHNVYNEIAPHFSYTRYKPWPFVSSFLNDLQKGSLVLDVGCGNGKYIGVNPDILMIGCDRSQELISICADRGHEALVCDGLSVPMKTNTFDACISIAVIHHFSTEERRLEAIKELVRILRPGGLALVYVWAMEQKKQNKKSIYLMKKKKTGIEHDSQEKNSMTPGNNKESTSSEGINYSMERQIDLTDRLKIDGNTSDKNVEESEHSVSLKETEENKMGSNCAGDCMRDNICQESSHDSQLRDMALFPAERGAHLTVHVNKTEFRDQDLLVPWHLRKTNSEGTVGEQKSVFYRFYHVFQEGELEKLVKKVKGVSIRKSYYDQGNWCVIFAKGQ